MKTRLGVLILFAVVLAVLAAGIGCTGGGTVDNTDELKPVEVREYQGENLSSINDFRENSIKGPQQVDIESYRLKISGLVENSKTYTYDEVINNHQSYEKVVTLDCVEGWRVTILWKGLLIKDLLAEAQPQPDARVVIFHAYDGYTTSFPVEYIMDNDILIAYKMNDVVLPSARGFPFELVAESKWGYKWIKWITEIELSDDVNYRGYWEQRGFSNRATSTKASSEDEKHIEGEFSQAGSTLAAAGCISALSSYRLRHYAIQGCRAGDIRVTK